MESQIANLRQELGEEFHKADTKLAEIHGLITSVAERKTAMTLELDASFAEFDGKSSYMRGLTDQSHTVLEQTKTYVGGTLIALSERLNSVEGKFGAVATAMRAVHTKHS